MSRILIVVHVMIVAVFAASLLLTPVMIDGTHMGDTLLLAHLGWRGLDGLQPVVDFAHFYGGMTTAFVTAAFKLFGASFKSIDFAFVMMFAASAFALFVFSWRRISVLAITLLIALSAALVLSLSPIELGQILVPAHSFVYNHVGMVLMMGLVVFALVPVESGRQDAATSLFAGYVGYALILLKTTFGIMLPGILLACAVQRRWRSALLVLLGLTIGMMAMDPGMVRARGSLEFLLSSAAADRAGGIAGLVGTALTVIRSQSPQLAVILVLGGLLIWSRGRGSIRMLAAALFCALSFLASVLTMDGVPTLKLIPFIATFALIVTQGSPIPQSRRVLRAALMCFPFGLTYALVVPTMATSALVFFHSFGYAGRPFVERGPLSGYVVVGPPTERSGLTGTTAAERRNEVVARTLERLADGRDNLDASDAYVMLLEGVALLQAIPDAQSYGIIGSGAGFEFTFPLQSKVVPGYPVWPTGGLPGLETEGVLGPDVDLVMIFTDLPKAGAVNEELKTLVAEDHVPCRKSTFWTLYARRTLARDLCDVDQVGTDD